MHSTTSADKSVSSWSVEQPDKCGALKGCLRVALTMCTFISLERSLQVAFRISVVNVINKFHMLFSIMHSVDSEGYSSPKKSPGANV